MTPGQIAELLASEFCGPYDTVQDWRRTVHINARHSWESAARQAMDRMKQAAVKLAGGTIDRAGFTRLMRERTDDLAREMTGIKIKCDPKDWPAYLDSLDAAGWQTGESERTKAKRIIEMVQKAEHRYIVKLDRILAQGIQHPALSAEHQPAMEG